MKYSQMTDAQREQHDNLMAYWRERNPRRVLTEVPVIPQSVQVQLASVSARMWEKFGAEWEARRERFLNGPKN